MDSRRLYQLWKSLSDAHHPWNKFGCGNKDTLLKGNVEDGSESRQRVMDWWQNHYCASRMKVTVVGTESLKVLGDLAYQNFSKVPNRSLGPLPVTTSPPWSTSSGPDLWFVKTVKDTQRLEISFPIPDQDSLYEHKPSSYISHLIGHEGPGSIFNLLHEQGLATTLSCGLHSAGRGVSLMDIDITLTKLGLGQYEKVLSAIFHYITLLPSALEEPYHFEELRKMAQISFANAEKYAPDAYAKTISQSMNGIYKRDHLISRGVKSWTFNKAHIEDIIRCMTFDKARIFVAAKSFDSMNVQSNWEKEKWYGTEYTKQSLNRDILSILTPEDRALLYLPERNPLLPESLDVGSRSGIDPLKSPVNLHQRPLSTLWYKKDDQFWVPKGSITVQIHSPSTSGTHRQWVQTKVYSQLVMDGLTAKGYNATLAGLDYSVYSSLNGVFVTVSGYNDKLLAALDMVLEQVQALQVRNDRFDVVMEKMKRAYDNVYLKQSGEVSDTFLGDCTSERLYSPPFTRRELDYIDVESVRVHGGRLFERIHLTVLIHGNVTHDTAVSWCDRIERRFAAARAVPIPASACHSRRSLLLPSGCNFVYTAAVPNANEANCAVSYLCQVGDVADVRVRALVSLFSSMVSEPFFSMMRTKEQLGYNVSSSIWNETASGGVRFRIQSTRHPDFLESRIDFFIDWYLDVLKAMESAEFDEYRRGAVEKKRKKLVNLAEEQTRFWNYIENGYLDFERAENDAREIEKLTLSDIIGFVETYLHPSSPGRRKLSIRLVSQVGQCPGARTSSSISQGVPATLYSQEELVKLRSTMVLSVCATPLISGRPPPVAAF
ncbi:hypothetical protein FRC19_003029 [Serendipita sp. 401]|nr:hypothetical protein FRC19_003029 [Serendipita sp. 401]